MVNVKAASLSMAAQALRHKTFFSLSLLILLLSGCASAPDRSSIQPSHSLPPPDSGALVATAASTLTATKHSDQSSLYLLQEGANALASRLTLIENAERSLDLQYYIYQHDTTGAITSWGLLRAAERGVRVRLLLDDLGYRQQDYPLTVLNAHPNIEVRLYNPFYWRSLRWLQMLGDFDRLNHRMHNKALIADSSFAVIGGRNIGDKYFGANQNLNFGDMDVLLAGPSVTQARQSFDDYWNSSATFPLGLLNSHRITPKEQRQLSDDLQASFIKISSTDYKEQLTSLPLLERLQQRQLAVYHAPVDIWSDHSEFTSLATSDSKTADKESPTRVYERLLTLFNQAQKELFLVSPYFVPGEKGTQRLVDKARSGVSIQVVTNSLAATDVVAVYGGYSQYREALLRGGIKLYEIKLSPNVEPKSWSLSSNSAVHAKVFIVDNRWVFIGSFNLDPRSAFINTELGVVIDSPELATRLKADMSGNLDKTAYQLSWQNQQIQWTDMHTQQVYYNDPKAGFWREFMAGFFELLPIESQL